MSYCSNDSIYCSVNYFMKRSIQFFAPFFILVTLFWAFCSKEAAFQSKGIITGPDYRKCACFGEKCGCCGNYVIEINQKGHLFVDLPKEPGLDLKTAKFPINISLDWRVDPDSCAQAWGYILIDRYRID